MKRQLDGDYNPLNVSVFRSQKRTQELFLPNLYQPFASNFDSDRLKVSAKIFDEYAQVKDMAPPQAKMQKLDDREEDVSNTAKVVQELQRVPVKTATQKAEEMALVTFEGEQRSQLALTADGQPGHNVGGFGSKSLMLPGNNLLMARTKGA